MVVQHNLTAMNSNRMLGITTSSQAKSTEKLSSGYKINRAADDAAGLSISEKMRKQIRGLTQASTNAQDGISAVQTAEGALNEVQDMLQRMNELAVKAANGTNSTDDRSYIQDEVNQLIEEIDRVSETTKFNETYLLKGDENGTAKTKFAYKSTNVLSKDVWYMNSNGTATKVAAGAYFAGLDTTKDYYSTGDFAKVGKDLASTAFESSTNVISGKNWYSKNGDVYTLLNDGDTIAANATIYSGTYDPNATIQAMDSAYASDQPVKYTNTVAVYDSTGASYASGKLVIDDSADYSNYYGGIASAALMQGGTIDISSLKQEKTAEFTDKDGNKVAENGLYRYIDEDGTLKGDLRINGGTKASQTNVDDFVDHSGKFNRGVLELKLHVGADATDNNQISIELEAMSAEELGVDNVRVDGPDDTNARDAIETIKQALQKVSTQRSALGAVQNRLEHTIANLDNVVENTTSAESTIRDTDMATEMVKFSNNNILAQAGQAMLAQANQSNQGVLSILG